MIADPFLLTVIACAALTIAVRALPIVFLAGVSLPRFALDWLGFVPCAIMVAIVVLELAGHADKPGGLLPALLASLVATALALVSRSLFATVLGGVGFYLAWFLIG
ncbi:AzlD domain-containing protein [Pseudomonas sp. DTU_2021_1001937_2_SI_NGA_ILE_001]|uniref:AzlD domain-containing protein n=1 Tax=Pseudomonas sp. DTU_2021_1001937_2_SI_NGA_ILE_001 TaxID=3077589 RepID=UPI0028FC1A7C|nr:AzlD domain-containing protein [Pseudomonas sp. DTU_2021_1001937_2_SI_NGA_ILE_001]WNW09906.1 AzlD domain-containing protein [Pseudomonas sp. DTU_2021_1001937_2_SI_NGA_ILE_001]